MEVVDTQKVLNDVKLNLVHAHEQSTLAVCDGFLVLDRANLTSWMTNF